ncbi:MAG: trypsin-like peptidase domain-containing protein [Lachnospiraceae bacterium]|nr:trypsin-like peptidase domain-containing protein [Lachnospiraceae bacterium]
MRDGYGRNKLFFLVILSMVGILLMPYGILGKPGRSTGKNNEESTSDIVDSVAVDSVTVDSVVEIAVKDTAQNVIYASGNGVVLEMNEKEICIVTAGHVLDRVAEDKQVVVGFRDPENWTHDAEFEIVCDRYETVWDADLAFLFLTRAELEKEKLQPQKVSVAEKQDYDGLKAGDTVRTIGWDEGQKVVYEGELQENWIFVEDFSQYMMLAECVMRPGMSGCGLYNAQDQLIGIACGGNEAGQLAAVPLHVVQTGRGEMD